MSSYSSAAQSGGQDPQGVAFLDWNSNGLHSCKVVELVALFLQKGGAAEKFWGKIYKLRQLASG